MVSCGARGGAAAVEAGLSVNAYVVVSWVSVRGEGDAYVRRLGRRGHGHHQPARYMAAVVFTVDATGVTAQPTLSSEEIADKAAAHPDVLRADARVNVRSAAPVSQPRQP